jgi:ABC-type proline/glycine betaine transport system ATPase subunit
VSGYPEWRRPLWSHEIDYGLGDEVGMTLILITHDLTFAWALAERVAIIYLGK